MQNLWRKSRRAVSILLACAVLASMTPAQALAEEADGAASLQAGPAQTQNAETEVLPAQDGAAQESETSQNL